MILTLLIQDDNLHKVNPDYTFSLLAKTIQYIMYMCVFIQKSFFHFCIPFFLWQAVSIERTRAQLLRS